MFYEVFSVVEGALEGSDYYDDEQAADAAMEALRDDYRQNLPEADWQVFILPHYHEQDSDEECTCVQWLQDHRPTYSSEGV